MFREVSMDSVDLFEDKNRLELDNNVQIQEFVFDPYVFLEKTSAWYGGTGSGKTFHAKFAISKLQEFFPRVVLFSPTNHQSTDFDGIINKVQIIEEFTPDLFLRVYKQAEKNGNIYRTANKFEILLELFNKFAPPQAKVEMQRLLERKMQKVRDIQAAEVKIELQRKKIKDFVESIDAVLKQYIKVNIAPLRNKLLADFAAKKEGLSDDVFTALKFLDFNPRILIIFDDCQTELAELLKSEKKNIEAVAALKNIFSRGRHSFITSIFICQDDIVFKQWMRKGIKNNIITSRAMASTFFQRTGTAANAEGPTRKLALKVIEKMFIDEKDHRKLLFRPEISGNAGFSWTLACETGLFTTGSRIVRKFSEKIQK